MAQYFFDPTVDKYSFPKDEEEERTTTDKLMEDLSVCWFLFNSTLETDLTEFTRINRGRASLRQTLYARLSLEPGKDMSGSEEYLGGARYEMPKYGREVLFPEAMMHKVENPAAWMDFLCGMPYGSCEMLLLVGEVTTKQDKWPFCQGWSMPVAPIPRNFFEEDVYGESKTAFNLLWLQHPRVEAMADGVGGEPAIGSPNWWLRVNFTDDDLYPYPGEFVGLAARIFPGLVSGQNPFSPFLYSGNWFDTAYVTSGEAMVVEAHADGYYICTVDWRIEGILQVYPTDFTCYNVGDRITIVKALDSTKPSQLWKDEDCWTFDREVWKAVPLTFYGKGFEEE